MTEAKVSLLFSPADNPAVIAHMNTLQSVIARLVNNSVSCKTWCLTLITALISLAGAVKSPGTLSFVLLPLAVFAFLDTMYLSQEKAYRKCYDLMTQKLRAATYGINDLYDLAAPVAVADIIRALGSWSIWPVYGGLFVAYMCADRAGLLTRLITS